MDVPVLGVIEDARVLPSALRGGDAMVSRILGTFLLMLPLVGAAQTVHKCKGVDGNTVYQSFPCAGAVPAEKTWTGQYRQPTNAELWQRYRTDQKWAQRQQSEQARRGAGVHYAMPSVASKSSRNASACAVVRSEYQRVQSNFRLNRNIELLRRLEADIYRYCESRP